MGARLVLMQSETSGRAEGVRAIENSFYFIDVSRFEVVQSLPMIGFRQQVGAARRPSHRVEFLAEQETALQALRAASQRHNRELLARAARRGDTTAPGYIKSFSHQRLDPRLFLRLS